MRKYHYFRGVCAECVRHGKCKKESAISTGNGACSALHLSRRGLEARYAPLESMRSRLCAALGLPADSAPETVAARAETAIARPVAVRRCEITDAALVNVRSWFGTDQPGAMVWVRPIEVMDAAKIDVLSADCALGDGMAQISERELACMRAELEYRRAQSDEAPDSVLDPLWDAFDALRANQGGA